ncbi:MAG: TIM-barrel domain-containing protein, partial [Thermodesulfobacteriota bacterium]
GATVRLTIAPGRDGATTRLRVEAAGEPAPSSIALPVRCDADASFHGFGEQYHATDHRGEAFQLFVTEQGIGRIPGTPDPAVQVIGTPHTTYFPMPYWLDARGFGVLLHTSRRVDVDLCAAEPPVAWLEVVGPEPVDVTVFHGPGMLDVIRQLGDEVGRPTPPPDWAFDLWIGSQGGRDAVLTEADALEAADIPARVLWVQDWTGFRSNLGGGSGVQYRWQADPQHYPDLAGMIAELHARGYRFLTYVNPFVDPDLPNHFADMAAQGLLIMREDGSPYVHFAPNGEASHPDLTNPAAREHVKSFLRVMVRDLGMDGFMADFGEWLPLDARLADGSDPLALHDLYPLQWHSLWREVMDEIRPDGDFAVFARSGFTGVHAVAQIYWVGDQEATFSPHDGLPTVVPAMLSLGLSGIPFVTHDVAGFSGGPSTKELFLRWTELGAFTPIMRTHEGNRRLENWSWEKDAETTAHFRRFARIHQALGPELRALAAEAAATSAPIVRHLMLVFPDDPASRTVSDQYMLGESLLVAPVVAAGATTRDVYLPPGRWFDVWSGAAFEGGGTTRVDAPIGRPPVFSRGADRADLRGIR